ncbi:hypothetical protein EHS13_29890 [Paenibacillus psychroresistens]|uniref:Uncharacterized protein n=1 Tax=Paenibacillus psychroresistens TaxID=1778678 RepID=A0A6B8RUE8_9BACL|nr:hypothetical protein [Paenibacillus psychroresistens]QGQ98788.1 hypothetical protein EHS13_29890 [Paenibacillus psychroresistens]
MNEADDAFDIISLIMVLAIFVPIMVYCAIPYFQGDVGGFGVQIEKAALGKESEIVPTPRPITTNDVMLMLVVADKNARAPQKIRISLSGPSGIHTEIPLDAEFFSNRALKLQDAKLVMPTTVPIYLQLYSGPSISSDMSDLSGMRFWDVKPQ